jgi:hypothetical protein
MPAHAQGNSCYPSATGRRAAIVCGCELIDRVGAGPPIRKFLLVELLGHVRVSFPSYRPDHHARVELAAIDTHRATKATDRSMRTTRAMSGFLSCRIHTDGEKSDILMDRSTIC